MTEVMPFLFAEESAHEKEIEACRRPSRGAYPLFLCRTGCGAGTIISTEACLIMDEEAIRRVKEIMDARAANAERWSKAGIKMNIVYEPIPEELYKEYLRRYEYEEYLRRYKSNSYDSLSDSQWEALKKYSINNTGCALLLFLGTSLAALTVWCISFI